MSSKQQKPAKLDIYNLCALSWVWCGLVLGVSFLATPAKFLAQGLSLPVALEVGRVTFSMLLRIELVLCLAIVIALIRCKDFLKPSYTLWYVIPIIMVALELFWLKDILDARISVIQHGNVLPKSIHHHLYIIFEAIKVVALLTLPFYILKNTDTRA